LGGDERLDGRVAHPFPKTPNIGDHMTNPKFPGSVEIKRVIAAVTRAGIDIGSIEIQPRKIIIHPKEEGASPISGYDIWKVSQHQNTDRVKHSVEKSDALPKKPRR